MSTKLVRPAGRVPTVVAFFQMPRLASQASRRAVRPVSEKKLVPAASVAISSKSTPLPERWTLKPASSAELSSHPRRALSADSAITLNDDGAAGKPVATLRKAATVSAVWFMERALSAELAGSDSWLMPVGQPLKVTSGLENWVTRLA